MIQDTFPHIFKLNWIFEKLQHLLFLMLFKITFRPSNVSSAVGWICLKKFIVKIHRGLLTCAEILHAISAAQKGGNLLSCWSVGYDISSVTGSLSFYCKRSCIYLFARMSLSPVFQYLAKVIYCDK